MAGRRGAIALDAARSAPRTFAVAATVPGALAFLILTLAHPPSRPLSALVLTFLALVSLAAGIGLVARRTPRPFTRLVAGAMLAVPLLAANLALTYAGCSTTADQGTSGGFGWEKSPPKATSARERARVAALLPPRPTNTPPELIDLSGVYNATLAEDHYTPFSRQNLAALTPGILRLPEAAFDLRGLVRVASQPRTDSLTRRFPRSVDGIPVGRVCRRLHFVHGCGWPAPEGTVAGHYRVRYRDGRTTEIPIVLGRDLLPTWSAGAGSDPASPDAEGSPVKVAWQGTARPPSAFALPARARLYLQTWPNPRPDVPVATLEVSADADAFVTLFLAAVTAE